MAIKAVVTLPFKSGLPKDVATNTFVIGGVGSSISAGDRIDLVGAISNVYDTDMTGTTSTLGGILHPCLDRTANAASIKLYDISGHLDGSPHGSPFGVDTFTLPAAGPGAGLPEEVAVAVTLEAANRANQRVEVPDGVDPGSAVDRPRQRYTGRLFIGPLLNTWVDQETTSGATRILAVHRTALMNTVATLANAISTNIPGAFLGVWSRSDEAVREISHVSIDNAFDTQRRRGASATTRTRAVVTGAGQAVELAA